MASIDRGLRFVVVLGAIKSESTVKDSKAFTSNSSCLAKAELILGEIRLSPNAVVMMHKRRRG
jgi:hypothetical protein